MQGNPCFAFAARLPSVKDVFNSGPPERCYLVEWYQSALLTGPLDERLSGSAAAMTPPKAVFTWC